MQTFERKNRRLVAKWAMGLISLLVLWVMMPGDIGPIEQAVVMLMLPSLVGLVGAFIGFETYSDHSARKHKRADND